MPSASELLEPRTAAEAAEAMREAARRGSVSLDRPGGDVVVASGAMTALIEHEATDLTCVVEPGLRLSQLDAQLAPHGQRLALDPPGDPTIGECILDALSGPRRHRFGAVRDLILGVTVALPDGTVASSGGKVVKNVAGYDLAKLFCGSRGTLGLVVRAAFRLHPRPETDATIEVALERPADAGAAVQRLQRSSLVTSALDVQWPGRLLALLEGSPRVVSAGLAEAAELLAAREIAGTAWSEVREQQERAQAAIPFEPGALEQLLTQETSTLARPTVGVAYVERRVDAEPGPVLARLRERVRRSFDPEGALVG